MIHGQMNKIVQVIKPTSFGTSATVSGTISVSGFDYAQVYMCLDSQTAASVDSVLQISFGDTTSTFTTEAAAAMTTAAPDTSNPQYYCWHIDLKQRTKFLKVAYQPTVGARLGTCIAILSRAEQPGTTLAQRGLVGQVIL